jgi:hypothetical protein
MRKFVLLLAMLLLAVPVLAQDPVATPEPMPMDSGMMVEGTPMVAVSDQVSLDGTVVIDEIFSNGPGWIVIHTDNGGAPGPVAGMTLLAPGVNANVTVKLYGEGMADPTPTLFAMLHVDDGAAGVYEFGTVEGADGPVSVDGAVVTPAFAFSSIYGWDQFIGTDNLLTIASVTIGTPGFLVIHSGDPATFGPVLANVALAAGTTNDVMVEVPAEGRTEVLWPMLHVDTGAAGVYEFGTVEGADGPVVVGGAVATTAIYTVPNMRVASQIVLMGDNAPAGMMMNDMGTGVMAASVLSQGPGFLVIHSDNGGSPGPVLGFAPVSDGLNRDVFVEISGEITPVVFPMLHVDTGAVGTYEFGTVEGADGPVRVFDAVLTFPINIAPSITFEDQPLAVHEDNVPHLHIDEVLIDAHGWLVIHSSADGAPGPVINQIALMPGLTRNIMIEVDAELAGAQVFPMLHYDTGVPGVYEFGMVEGADAPVFFNEAVVVAPLAILPPQ